MMPILPSLAIAATMLVTAASRPPRPVAVVPPRAAAPAPQDAQKVQAVAAAAPLPFGVGENAAYEVRFSALRVGQGNMQVVGIETLRGRPVFHTVFRVKGGTFFYKVNDVFESWFDTKTLASLRFRQDQQEGSRDKERTFEIYPERSTFSEDGKPEEKSVPLPLDDGSFIYFIRTVPLEVGRTYEFNRYFRPDRNPVKLRVLRREKVTVPAGTFNAIVVQPSIKTKGIFSEGGRAEIWFSDDPTRVMLQMKSQLSFGSLNLYLKSYTPANNPGSRR